MDKISVTKNALYDPQALDLAIDTHMSAFGMQHRIDSRTKIVLKPNLLMRAAPDRAITTHPEIIAAVLRWLRGHGAVDITIAESPGGPHTKSQLEGVYRACKIVDIANKYDAKLNIDTGWSAMQCPEGKICREFTIINPIAQADIIINLPKLKTHGMTMLSGAVKNMMGIIPGLQKPEMHFRFQDKAAFGRMLVDLSLTKPPTLTIVDAVISMEGDGPSGGTPRETGQIFAAENPHALDLALCEFIGMPAQHVPTLSDAIQRGMCPESADNLKYVGDGCPPSVEGYKFPSSRPLAFHTFLPKFLQKPVGFLSDKMLTPYPVVRPRSCTGCGKCAESCPPDAIRFHNRVAKIDYKECIKCFCCHEMCPEKAIDIRRSRIFKR